MNAMSRGVRNAFRNWVRTVAIVVIVGLSLGLALSMLVARQAVERKIQSVKSSIGNTITIAPAGFRGFQGGGDALTSDELAKVAKLDHVTKTSETLSDRLTTDNSNLQSAIDPGTLGRRQAGRTGLNFTVVPRDGGAPSSLDPNDPRISFKLPVIVTGANDTTNPSVFGGSNLKFTSGQNIDASKDADVALVGTSLAAKNDLHVGSTFQAYNTTITVAGVYDTGSAFANAGLVMPLSTVQRLSDQAGDITNATVTVDSVENLDATVNAIKSTLGSKADVTSDQEAAQAAVDPLESVRTISLFSLVIALIAGAVIILLTMVMIVRERRREIGVMKAIGGSNFKTSLQFVSEAITLTVLGAIAGLLLGVVAANPVTNMLVTNATNNARSANGMDIPGIPANKTSFLGPRGEVRRIGGLRGLGKNSLASVRNLKTSVGFGTLGFGLGAAVLIAIVGSAVPALLISKISPAEVMRSE